MQADISDAGQRIAMVASVCDGLASEEAGARLKSLRQIKNQVIGSKSKKAEYIKAGAVPLVLALLQSQRRSQGGASESDAIIIQSAATLGSLACGSAAGMAQLLQHAGVDELATTLGLSTDPRVIEACMRALKLVYSQQVGGGRSCGTRG